MNASGGLGRILDVLWLGLLTTDEWGFFESSTGSM
jgi:hypothetical protein